MRTFSAILVIALANPAFGIDQSELGWFASSYTFDFDPEGIVIHLPDDPLHEPPAANHDMTPTSPPPGPEDGAPILTPAPRGMGETGQRMGGDSALREPGGSEIGDGKIGVGVQPKAIPLSPDFQRFREALRQRLSKSHASNNDLQRWSEQRMRSFFLAALRFQHQLEIAARLQSIQQLRGQIASHEKTASDLRKTIRAQAGELAGREEWSTIGASVHSLISAHNSAPASVEAILSKASATQPRTNTSGDVASPGKVPLVPELDAGTHIRVTELGMVGYDSLVAADEVVRNAEMALDMDSPTVAEQASHLALAELSIDSADFEFSQGNYASGFSILDGVRAVVDDVLNYDAVRDTVTTGFVFIGGIIDGVLPLSPGTAFRGYEGAWAAGQLVGAGLGLFGDAAFIFAGLGAIGGGGSAAVLTGGVLAPIGAAIAGEGIVLAAMGAAGSGAHAAKGKTALDTLFGRQDGLAARPKNSKIGALHLPATHGKWSGARGDSLWHSTSPEVLHHTKGEGVPFTNGRVRFEKWSVEKVQIKGLTGQRSDFDLANSWLKDKMGMKTLREARAWVREHGLTWHHVEDCLTMILVPTALHRVPHAGGASLLEHGGCP